MEQTEEVKTTPEVPVKNNKKTLYIVGGVLLAVILACLGGFFVWKYVLTKNGDFTLNAKGLKVQPTTNIAVKVSKDVVAADGASMEVDNAGVKSTLNLDKASLPASSQITVTGLTAIANLPAGLQFATGVELGPDGTKLDKSSTLRLDLPAAVASQRIMGFSYSGTGGDLHFYPIKLENNTAIFSLDSFSGYGILVLQDENATPPPPSTIEKQAKQYIAAITKDAQRSDWGGLDQDHLRRIKNILTGWYNVSVKPGLKAAEGNEGKLDGAISEFISWQKCTQMFGLDDDFKAEIEASLNSAATGIKNASDKAGKACVSDKDPNQASKLMRYYAMTTLMDLDGRSGLSANKIQELIQKCVKFKINITSSVTVTYGGASTVIEASGQGTLVTDANMKLSGSGTVTTTRNQTLTLLPCTSSVPEVWPFTISDVSLGTSKAGSSLVLPFDLGSPPDLDWECGASLRQLVDNASVVEGGAAWDWDLLHQDELLSHTETVGSYLIKGWTMGGGAGVYATKKYDRTVNTGLSPATYKELTTLELVHTPSN